MANDDAIFQRGYTTRCHEWYSRGVFRRHLVGADPPSAPERSFRKRLRVSLLCVALLSVSSGCRSATVTYPLCPIPVLISKVDRIGKPVADPPAPSAPVGSVDGTVENKVLGGSGGQMGADGTIDRTHEETLSEPGMLTGALLSSWPIEVDLDEAEVRLDHVEIGAHSSYHLFVGAQGAEGSPSGTIERLK